jgi:NRAMP (natural resistance-associated macrophage protein)-like metal ion transporter
MNDPVDTTPPNNGLDRPDLPEHVKQPPRPTLIQIMGPGLITGASDDDPSGIATYSQYGAQFGFGLAWTLLVSYPLMAAIQEISARIGRVTGMGIAGNLKQHYPRWLAMILIGLLLGANVINLGADLGAMASAMKLLISGPQLLYVVLFGIFCVVLEVFTRYARYVSLLKWLCLSLFSYVICAFVVHVDWLVLAKAMILPPLPAKSDYVMGIVAIFGTTISPYLFFWQAEEEVEDEKERPGSRPLVKAPEQAPSELRRIRLDTYIGMGISNLIALFIIVTTAATLNVSGITDIQSTDQAAEALHSVAGRFTFLVFATGIIGTGLLTIPVLAGSAAYAVGEMMDWRVGLARRPSKARKFYVVIALATATGAAMNLIGINPIKALVWSAILNGVAAVPIMAMIMLLTHNPKVMGQFVVSPYLRTLGWLATAVMGIAAAAMIAGWFI